MFLVFAETVSLSAVFGSAFVGSPAVYSSSCRSGCESVDHIQDFKARMSTVPACSAVLLFRDSTKTCNFRLSLWTFSFLVLNSECEWRVHEKLCSELGRPWKSFRALVSVHATVAA